MVYWLSLNLIGSKDDVELDSPEDPERQEWGSLTMTQEMDQWVRIIELVVLSGEINKNNCRIRVNDKWNFDLMEILLVGYEDIEIIDYLKFGWPVERSEEVPLEMGGINHWGLQTMNIMLMFILKKRSG